MTEVITVDPIYPDREKLRKAASCIAKGGLVAFPTETVYGLGADCFNVRSVRKIFEVKMRPADNPLIVHICSREQLEKVASNIPQTAWKIFENGWPGPITVVIPKAQDLPGLVTGGLQSVAVRMPAHPVALGLISESGTPIAAPSANISGRPSPTSATHVMEDLLGKIDIILDGGETFFGVESTIVDLMGKIPSILRPGPFEVEELERLLDEKVMISDGARGLAEAEVALAPGMKYRHYAPKTKMILFELPDLNQMYRSMLRFARDSAEKGEKVGILCTDESEEIYRSAGFHTISLGSRGNLYTVARSLFRALRQMDTSGVTLILSESFEEKGLGLAIMNRLRKASSHSVTDQEI